MARARIDGGLRPIFRKHLPQVHWQSVETGLTGKGVPDSNGCYLGREFWVEYKKCGAIKVRIDPFQVAWHERRCRAGGRTFLAVGREDQLHLFRGEQIREVFDRGLRVRAPVFLCGGPSAWDWNLILKFLIQ